MKLVIDTDAGLDDAQAILMFLAHPEIDIKCITTVSGNADVSYCTKNVARILREAERQEIPLHRGCEYPILGNISSGDYHGEDGFGDNPNFDELDVVNVQDEHAVNKLIRLSKECKDELVLVALGPLTNIAMAIRLDPRFSQRLKSFYVMGGNYHGYGNCVPHGEFNFTYDPEAAKIVLHNLKCPITVACWELCLNCKSTWTWRTSVLGGKNSKCVEMLNKSERSLQKRFKEHRESEDYLFADQIIAGIMLYPEIVKSKETLPCTVVTDGQTKGLMVVDRRVRPDRFSTDWPLACLITSIDVTEFQNRMVADIHSLP